MPPRGNKSIWIGFALVLFAVLSYVPLFALFPITRDVPWVSYLLFLAGGGLLAVGVRRAFRDPARYRGKISGPILGVLSLLMIGFFCYGILVIGKRIPRAEHAPAVGQQAPDFTLADSNGKQIALSEILKDHRGALLIFYRGYW
jgi:hypothetical protein